MSKKHKKPEDQKVNEKPEVEANVPAQEEVDELMQTVTTPNGVEKTVVGDDKEEVKEAVKSVENDPKVVPLDINNPDHGNLTDEERQKKL